MDKKEDKGDGIIHKFTKELENIPESTTYIEVPSLTVLKIKKRYKRHINRHHSVFIL